MKKDDYKWRFNEVKEELGRTKIKRSA